MTRGGAGARASRGGRCSGRENRRRRRSGEGQRKERKERERGKRKEKRGGRERLSHGPYLAGTRRHMSHWGYLGWCGASGGARVRGGVGGELSLSVGAPGVGGSMSGAWGTLDCGREWGVSPLGRVTASLGGCGGRGARVGGGRHRRLPLPPPPPRRVAASRPDRRPPPPPQHHHHLHNSSTQGWGRRALAGRPAAGRGWAGEGRGHRHRRRRRRCRAHRRHICGGKER